VYILIKKPTVQNIEKIRLHLQVAQCCQSFNILPTVLKLHILAASVASQLTACYESMGPWNWCL